MTRDQGYRLIQLIFDPEELEPVHEFYTAKQKYLHYISYTVEISGINKKGLLCLGTLAEFKIYDDELYSHSIWSDATDKKELHDNLRNRYSFFPSFIETKTGKHAILHTLAHNSMISLLYNERLFNWNLYLNRYFGLNRESPDTIDEIFIPWHEVMPSAYIDHEDGEKSYSGSWYTLQYDYFYTKIEKELFDSSKSYIDKLIYIARLYKDDFDLESNYSYTVRNAYKSLASNYTFNNYEKWGTEDIEIENLIKGLTNKFSAVENTINLIPDIKKNLETNTPILTNINENTVSNASTLSKIQKHIENPAPKLYALAIEHGLFEKGDEKDSRYRIMGKVRTTLEQWLKILRENEFEQRELPTGASIKGKLRRKVSYNSDPQKENELIIKALNEVKSKKIGNSQ